MTKAEIVKQISDKTGISSVEVLRVVEAFMATTKDNMAKGENIYLRGFGTFAVTKRAKKVARNISKNTTIVIPEHFVPTFKPANTFKDKVKSNVKK